MKIRLFSLAAFFCLICVLFCGCDPNYIYEELGEGGKRVVYTSLEEMEASSPVIIECVRLETEKPVIGRNGNRIMNAYTLSEVQITKIHKDDTESLMVGDILRVMEYEVEEGGVIYHIGDYRKMVAGESYLLFVRRQSYGDGGDYYLASGITGGTISLGEDGRIDTSGGKHDSGKSLYGSIWQEAIEKYVN